MPLYGTPSAFICSYAADLTLSREAVMIDTAKLRPQSTTETLASHLSSCGAAGDALCVLECGR